MFLPPQPQSNPPKPPKLPTPPSKWAVVFSLTFDKLWLGLEIEIPNESPGLVIDEIES